MLTYVNRRDEIVGLELYNEAPNIKEILTQIPLEIIDTSNIKYILNYYNSNSGTNNNNYIKFILNSPSISHTVAHNMGKIPNIDVFTLGGAKIMATTIVTETTATVQFIQPQGCIIVITT